MSWEHIQGHARPIKSFQAAWRSNRLGQGYLFVGPAGVGKLTFAKELAKAVLCENPGAELRACDTCRSCILARAGTHPDILRAAREEDKNVLTKAVVDTLCGELVLKPALGKRRVAFTPCHRTDQRGRKVRSTSEARRQCLASGDFVGHAATSPADCRVARG